MENVAPIDTRVLSLADRVMKLSRNALIVKLRFMDSAISNLRSMPDRVGTFAVDGKHILYDPVYVLGLYGGGAEQVTRAYLHMVFHCVFRHFFIGSAVERELWDLACDIAVESIIAELDIRELATERDKRQLSVINDLRGKIRVITAEKIYRYLRENTPDPEALVALSLLFRTDDHSLWYKRENPENGAPDDNSDRDGKNPENGAPDDNSDRDGKNDPDGDGNESGGSGDDKRDESTGMDGRTAAEERELEQLWKRVSERMQMDLETFSREKGDKAGHLMQNLTAVNREKYDYTAFLKKFAVMGEAMRVNDDEFDYIFYTYGMRVFPEKRMPLIEPLEYKDVKRIREFVIAIDTSGSVRGELVQRFIQKTYNTLQSTDSFFSRINLHIIQCDAEIREHVRITDKDEFDAYLRNMQLKGFGGTDFRPVFNKVAELQESGEFTNLKGMIYFTDGYGEFPKRKPPFETAFVFVDDDYDEPSVPAWAIRLVLSKEEI